MQPEQLVLPFEDEVLSIVHKDEIQSTITGRFPEQRPTIKRLLMKAWFQARMLGFGVTNYRVDTEIRQHTLHIWLRAEAERA